MKLLLCLSACLLLLASAVAQQASPTCEECKQRVEEMQSTLNDWPELARYAKADAALPPPAKGHPRVVFLGDSITDAWKLDEYFPGQDYVNRGISGQTTPQMLVRFRPDVINLHPQVVVILAGINDIAGNTGPETPEMIEANLASIAELAHVHSIKVVMASVLPVSDYAPHPQTGQHPPAAINELNSWIQQYCRQNKLTYLDYYSNMVDEKGFLRADLSGDGLHPNPAGYKIMAPLAAQAIRTALH